MAKKLKKMDISLEGNVGSLIEGASVREEPLLP
jgi:hypothetical protein